MTDDLRRLLDAFVEAGCFLRWQPSTLAGDTAAEETPAVDLYRTEISLLGVSVDGVYPALRDMAQRWHSRPEAPAMRVALTRYEDACAADVLGRWGVAP